MLNQICFKAGPFPGASPLLIELSPMTVVVGPNNSGKSLLLREVEDDLKQPSPHAWKIVHEVRTSAFTKADIEQIISRGSRSIVHQGATTYESVTVTSPGHAGFGSRQASFPLNELTYYADNIEVTRKRRANLFPLFLLRLDGETRLRLLDQQTLGDLQQPAQNVLTALFQDEVKRTRVRELVHEAFGAYLVFDPTNVGSIRTRLSQRPPIDTSEECALDSRARSFHRAAPEIKEFSDGIRAYAGIMCAMISADFRAVLVDEPEAFLHPPLSRLLGRRLTELSRSTRSKMIVATHSPDFLMGCVDAGAPVGVVRLTYSAGVATARQLPASQLQILMRNPLLRSTGIVGALFSDGAVVSEADSDRAFYQECAIRLSAADSSLFKSHVFLNAQNKQTIRRVITPLRQMGVPAAAIVDLDILKKGDELRDLLIACSVPDSLRKAWGQFRGDIYAVYEKLGIDPKSAGVMQLPPSDRQGLMDVLKSVGEYGLFIVPVGELENWLKSLNVQVQKSEWIAEIFSKMGSDPESPAYVRPGAGDIWDFLRDVSAWLNNATRKGMPSIIQTSSPIQSQSGPQTPPPHTPPSPSDT